MHHTSSKNLEETKNAFFRNSVTNAVLALDLNNAQIDRYKVIKLTRNGSVAH